MQGCSYEIYVAAFRAVRQAMASGDAQELRIITSEAMGRTGAASLVSVLALIEARRGLPERTKADVCGGILCANRCANALVPPDWRPEQ